MARERVTLIDGSSMIYRAFFAIPSNLHTAQGLHTNAIYGFALMFRKILAGRKPSLGAVVFDAPGKTFRDEKYPEYKAQRPRMPSELKQQLPFIDRVVEVHHFPTVRVPGIEADDVIGTLTHEALRRGHEVHIISADKDFAQLIGEHVRMIDTVRDITYDQELVKKKWGVPPHQIVDLLALTGDKVDNVPGVPGIGQKGAGDLLAKYGDLDNLYAHLDELKGKRKTSLETHRDLATLSRELVTIKTDATLPVTLDDLKIGDAVSGEVDALYRELEFYSLIEGEAGPEVDAGDADFGALPSAAELGAWLEEGQGPLAFHCLYEPPSFVTGDLVGVALARSGTKARFVRLDGGDGSLGADAKETLGAWLADPKRPLIAHDLRDQKTLLLREGIVVRGVTGDTQLASFLVDPEKAIPHRLEQVAREVLHRAIATEKVVLGSGKTMRRFRDVALDELTAFACTQAAAVAEMWPSLEKQMAERGQREVLDTVCLPLSDVLAEIQRVGIRVDRDILRGLQKEFEARKAEVEASIYEMAGHEFNIASTKQLATVLFEELGLPVIKRTKTGYSTDADVLERLAHEHDIGRQIVRQRALAKLINTYTQVLLDAVNEETGRVHCTIQQTTGVSGRLITTDPDLQRTPIRTDDGKRIREAFIPKDGWDLVSADWSQIELRVLAHVSEDEALVAAFADQLDVHRRTAAQLFEVEEAEVTSAQRNVGKTVNFATIYGQGATALSQQLGITRDEASKYIQRYFARYPKVAAWRDRTVASAHELGYVTTILGRRRIVPELRSNNFTDRARGERQAVNTVIQGSAADLCKVAMLQIASRMREANLESRMLLQIHDELLFECPPAERETLISLVRDRMEHAMTLKVPLVVDIGYGASWAAAKE